MQGSKQEARLGLKAGEWIEVRSREEILATLDEHGRLDGLPFQPEMLAWCGQRLKVGKVAHKTCDTIHKTGGRRMLDAVHLEGIRCDGSMHGGCQANCLLFWKEAWLRRPGTKQAETLSAPSACSEADLHRLVQRQRRNLTDEPTWVCQTTQLFESTKPLSPRDFRQYLRDIRSGNVGPWKLICILSFAAFTQLLHTGVGYEWHLLWRFPLRRRA